MRTRALAALIATIAVFGTFAQASPPGAPSSASQAQARVPVSSAVVSVTVYSDRALVTRAAETPLSRGETVLVFSDLPSATDPASVQVSGSGAFSLRDVRVVTRQVVRDVSADVRRLEDEIRALEARLEIERDRTKEAEAERAFVADMAKRLTSNAGESESLPLDPAAWAKMLDFHRARNEAVDASIRSSKAAAKAIEVELDRARRELRSLGSGARLSVMEAELTLEAQVPAKARVELSYVVAGPSWRPDYVVRADSESKKLSVHYRAMVRQNTGEAWKDAALKLSTARPQVGGSLPELSPWFVDFYRPPVAKPAESAKMSRALAPAPAPSAAAGAMMDKAAEVAEPAPEMEVAVASAQSGATAVTFSIPGASTVEADNRERTVSVAVLDLPVAFSWAAVPKLSPYAYFRATATNASDFPFLPGRSHVYVDGAYVADAEMDSVPPGGEFKADLGVDEAVSVERKLKRKFDETTGVVSKKSKTTWEYLITVKNGKKAEIALKLTDQLPIPANEQIVVKTIEPAYSKDSETLRKLEGEAYEWTLKLAPGKETTIPLSFSVEYPKGAPIVGLE